LANAPAHVSTIPKQVCVGDVVQKREKAANVPNRGNFPVRAVRLRCALWPLSRRGNIYPPVARNPGESAPFHSSLIAGGGLSMDGIIYLVGLIVIIMFILSFFGLR